MTYADFLLRFLVVPIALLSVLIYRDRRKRRALPVTLRLLPPGLALTALAVIAVTYTTPWDNYLMATGVWWYDPALVTGVTLGWVPLEEYGFFVLQTALTGLWLLFLAPRLRAAPAFRSRRDLRVGSVAVVGAVWVASIAALVAGWQPGRYLALELAWALPAVALQLAVGADILWRYRRLVVPAIVSATLYYSAMDALAIHSGTWTINPELSLGMMLGGVLPLEEAIFFLLTNTLLVFGLVLALAQETADRLPASMMRALVSHGQPPSRPVGGLDSGQP